LLGVSGITKQLIALTSRISGRSQLGQLCAFSKGADRGEQAYHKDAAEGPFVVDRNLDFGEVVKRAEAVEKIREDVARCTRVSFDVRKVEELGTVLDLLAWM
jgi:hypothetical protein